MYARRYNEHWRCNERNLSSSIMSKSNGLSLRSLWKIVIVSFALTVTSAVSKSYCRIYDPELNYRYDLRKLIPSNSDIIVVPKHTKYNYNDTIRIQLCYPLKKKCDNKDGYSVCMQYANKTEKAIGKFPPIISNKDGQIICTFRGIICVMNYGDENTNIYGRYLIVINLQCDYSAVDNSRPVLEYFDRTGCTIYITWNTALACGPRKYIDCITAHKNQHYDLTALRSFSQNYKIYTEDTEVSEITLNICHSVIRKPDAICAINAGVCRYDKELGRYINMGNVDDPPYFEDGHLRLEYRNGDPCNVSNTTSYVAQNYRTTIIFTCVPTSEPRFPQFEGMIDKCHYQITWNTHAACSVEVLYDDDYDDQDVAGDCMVTNYDTGSLYDLRPLMDKDYTIEHFGVHYKLSICRALIDDTCEAGTGLCDIDHGISYGKARASVQWERYIDGPFINYLDGDVCPFYNWPSNTIIKFFCGGEASAHLPIIMEKIECEMSIHWITDLVCEKEILCNAHNYHAINLTSLMQHTKNYVVKHANLEFHINICRPLVPTPGLACENGTAVCAIQLDSNEQYIRKINLGYPVRNPRLIDNLVTVLRYIGGSPCQEDRYKRLSTNITFICANDLQGSPVYKGYADCTYLFEWYTRLACVAVKGTWKLPCTITHKYPTVKHNLSLLYKEQQMHYVKNEKGKEYIINLCNRKNYCNGSAVCDGTNDYGSLKKILFNYIGGNIKIEYLNGSECGNSSYTSKIILICNEFMGIGVPKLLLESKCSVEFEWETDIICTKRESQASTEVLSSQEERPFTEILMEDSFSYHVFASFIITSTAVGLGIIATLIGVIFYRKTRFSIRLLIYFRNCASCFNLRRYWNSIISRRVNQINEYSIVQLTIHETENDDDVFHV